MDYFPLMIFTVITLNAQLWKEVTLENASISNGDLTDDGVFYKHANEGSNINTPRIVSGSARKGTKFIRYSVGGSTSTKQRTEHAFVHYSNPDLCSPGAVRYAGFSFKIDADKFSQTNTWFNLFQVQMNDGGFPALQFVIGPNGLGLHLARGEKGHAPMSNIHTRGIPIPSPQKNVWHDVVVGFKYAPDHANGWAAVWIKKDNTTQHNTIC